MATANADDGEDSAPDSDSGPQPADFTRIIGDELERDNGGSYTDLNPYKFHASTIGYTTRGTYVRKLGLDTLGYDDLGAMKVGSMIHDFIEDAAGKDPETDLRLEQHVSHQEDGITFSGRYDAYDPEQGIVYDFKSRNGWYKFNPPSKRHIDQLLVYMHALDAPYGQVVYVSKRDLEVRTWPEDEPFKREDYADRWNYVLQKAKRVRDAILEHGVAMSPDDIPFEQGDDWLSQQEQLADWIEKKTEPEPESGSEG